MEKQQHKKTLCLDFDGVIHAYDSGWEGADVVSDPPVPGAMKFLVEATQTFHVCIYSARSGQDGGIKAMRTWIHEHLHRYMRDTDGIFYTMEEFELVFGAIKWPTGKPAAFVTLDDRAITFDGKWPSVHRLHAFVPWNKGGRNAALQT